MINTLTNANKDGFVSLSLERLDRHARAKGLARDDLSGISVHCHRTFPNLDAKIKHELNLIMDSFVRKAVLRNLCGAQAAQNVALLIDHHVGVPKASKKSRAADGRRAASNQCNLQY
jgi:hypothetical protein